MVNAFPGHQCHFVWISERCGDVLSHLFAVYISTSQTSGHSAAGFSVWCQALGST